MNASQARWLLQDSLSQKHFSDFITNPVNGSPSQVAGEAGGSCVSPCSFCFGVGQAPAVMKPSRGSAGCTNQSQGAGPAPEGGGRLVGVFFALRPIKITGEKQEVCGHPRASSGHPGMT